MPQHSLPLPRTPARAPKDPEMHAYCREVWLRWIAAEVAAGTTNQVENYLWQSYAPD